MKHINKYNINQSPLYKLHNLTRLSKVLGVDKTTIEKIIKRGDSNFRTTTLLSGRVVDIPKPQILRLHARINSLLSRIETPEYLSSGVKGKSHITNAKIHMGNTALCKLDIKSFYQSTKIDLVEKCFVKNFKCTRDVAKTLATLCCVRNHIPTGSPLSQSLAFFCNIGVFNHLNLYAKQRKIKFSLYVDDLTFSGKVIPKSFVDYVKNYIEKNRGYKCHKIRTHKAETPKVVTGAVLVDGTIKVRNRHKEKIHSMLSGQEKLINKHEPDSDELITHFQELIGRLFSAGQINGRYYSLGKEMVNLRTSLGVPAVNQNTLK